MDKRVDLALALLVVTLAAGYYLEAGQIPISRMSDPLGASAVPRLVAGLLVLSGLWMVVNRLRKWRDEPGWAVAQEGEPDDPDRPVSVRRVFAVVLLTGGYLLVLPVLGYITSTPVLLAVTLAIWGVRGWRQLVGISLGMTIVLYFAFGVLMQVPLPVGILERS